MRTLSCEFVIHFKIVNKEAFAPADITTLWLEQFQFSKISVSVRSISSGSPAAGVNLPQDLSVLSSPI